MANYLITCSCCGRTIDLDGFKTHNPITARMKNEQLCFDCLFWKDIIHNRKPDYKVIDGDLYEFHPILKEHVSKREVKYKDALFVFDLHSHKAYASTSYRYIGTVPKNFKSELSDDLRLISEDTFWRFQNYEGTCCMSKGCFDRYNCYWYHPEIAEPDGPWNTIPPSYKMGGENCESFIDKQIIFK